MENNIGSAGESEKTIRHVTIHPNTIFVDDLIDLTDYVQPEESKENMLHSEEGAQDYSSGPDSNRTLLDLPLTPSRDYSPTSGPRYLTTSALANQLFRGRPGGSSVRGLSRRSSVGSDDLESISASDPGGIVVSPEELSELNSRMVKIQEQLAQQRDTDEKYVRLKQENAVLREKLNSLEEQMMVNEDKFRSALMEAERKNKELLAHVEREKWLELDAVSLRCRLLEQEHESCTAEKARLCNEADQLKQKYQRLEETLTDLQRELELNENEKKNGDGKLWKEKEDAEKRLRIALENCEELRSLVERLKNEQGRLDGSASELEEELQRMKEEQKQLRQTNDELHAELLHASVEHGRKLLSNTAPSLADEMNRMSKDQVLEALRDQEIVNKKLRVYVDGILLRILEMYPEILEIKPGEKGLDPI